MKAEETENSIKFIPETEFEKRQLISLRRKTIKKVEFEDDWRYKGYLEISFKEWL